MEIQKMSVYQVEEYYIYATVTDVKAAQHFIDNCEEIVCQDARIEGDSIIIDGFESESHADRIYAMMREFAE